MDNDKAKPNSKSAALRDLGRQIRTRRYPASVDRWALIVGVSQYEHSDWNLKFADRDARKLLEFIQTPAGGAFESDKILPLVNENATTANITKGLRSFLKQPGRDDIVLLYFACHGAPDPDRPENIYLLTHDADPADVSGTALPMREIQLTLTETLHAERVVMLADTCHSGKLGAGTDRRLATTEAGVMNKYLQELSEARGGVALLTSAEANETSQEGKEWGGGHGVFTHFLLEGLRGAADGYAERPRDGKVTVRELFEYVRDNVKAATKVQHPVIGPHVFDENLPMAITGEVNARECCNLAERLEVLAQLFGEAHRFRAAAAQFREALELARAVGGGVSKAELGYARSLLAAGDVNDAVLELTKLATCDTSETFSQASFYLGIAEAKLHRYREAKASFQAFLQGDGQDEGTAWVREYANWLSMPSGRKVAVLIGINEYQAGHEFRLAACINDVRLVEHAFINRVGFDKQEVKQLCDQQATRENILAAFKELTATLKPEDQVWVYYSGHSVPETAREADAMKSAKDPYLIVHDTKHEAGHLINSISPEELHASFKKLPSRHKTIVLDTHPSSELVRLAQSDDDYVLFVGADFAESAVETQVEIGGERQPVGLFTAALTDCLSKADPQSITCGEMLNSAMSYIRDRSFEQTPLLVGDRDRFFFGIEDIYLGAFDFAKRRNYTVLNPEFVERLYRRIAPQLLSPFPEFHYSVGRALTEYGQFAAALVPLKTALAQSGDEQTEVAAMLARAQLGAYHDAEADETMRQHVPAIWAQSSISSSARANMEALLVGGRYAVLVGIQHYLSPDIPSVKGAANDVLLMKKHLREYCQFRDEDIVILMDSEATRSAIIDRFTELCAKGRSESALFYFAGNGSLGPGMRPTLVSADSREGGIYDIEVSELAALAIETNITSILDTGWKPDLAMNAKEDVENGFTGGWRTITQDLRTRPASRGIDAWVRETAFRNWDLQVGALTIFGNGAIPFSDWEEKALELQCAPKTKRSPLLANESAIHGTLTYYLASALRSVGEKMLTYRQWLEVTNRAARSEVAKAVGLALDVQLFDNVIMRTALMKELEALDDQSVHELIEMLLRLVEQRKRQGSVDPQDWLNLGIAYYEICDYDKAISALKNAVTLYEDEPSVDEAHRGDPLAEEYRCEAYYQLGRALYQSNRNYTRAVDALNKALDCDPENPGVLYHLGQAVRKMVERETLSKAETVLKKYLEKGAPLGHEDEVREFLDSRPGPDPWV